MSNTFYVFTFTFSGRHRARGGCRAAAFFNSGGWILSVPLCISYLSMKEQVTRGDEERSLTAEKAELFSEVRRFLSYSFVIFPSRREEMVRLLL